MGAWAAFASQASGWDDLFPGVDVRLVTLKLNFFIPFFDLFLTFMGVCDASKESCDAILHNRSSLAIVLGGAKEALDAHAGDVVLFLAERKGFVKVALSNGASLVPVFGFGENDLYFQGQLSDSFKKEYNKGLDLQFQYFEGVEYFNIILAYFLNEFRLILSLGNLLSVPNYRPKK
ncbi:diacylglycerol O-acyltransferase [Reticulomyxa filosa]|uniref:diacylglycerol O-acyltransferase n=1 Tax=Reticulomyxa filosa TaxID=46433 RepID=X6M2H5_RETFI|nr:diacylglycerol O-acyltransferase [Reticulomyxa filosa]|eukprot:ETO07781.1 diacylglycerol O-acyltransferase [Reticulomyxa filosa]